VFNLNNTIAFIYYLKNFAFLSPYRWVIVFICWLIVFIGMYAQFQVSALAFKIIPELGLSPDQFYKVLLAPMLPAVFLSFVAGALADRFGVKNVVTVGLIIAIPGVWCRYMVDSFTGMFILMMMAGMSQALLSPICAKLLGAWFPMKQLNTAMDYIFQAPVLE
jgi:MFS family permease